MTSATQRASNNDAEPNKWRDRRWIVWISIVIGAILLLAFFFADSRRPILLVGIVFAGVGIFPLTYFAYLSFRAPAQRDRLKDDFRLLGLASTGELDSVVEKLYNTAYSTTHFAVFISLIVVFCLLTGTAFLYQSGNVLLKNLPSLRFADIVTPWVPDSTSPPQEASPATVPAGTTTLTATATITPTGTATSDGNGTAEVATGPESPPKPSAPEPQPMLVFFAFLGAYLFGIQELVRRYNTSDLLPQVYSSIFVRLILATGVVYVGSQLIASLLGASANEAPLAMVIAFLIGIFPQRGIDWLAEKSKDVFDTKMSITSVRPLTEIIGISPWHQARLEEMGIDDAQNLAMADIRKLLLTTQFDTQEIVNWIDQAILYVKVGTKITTLRENYINTFYELNAKLDAHKRDPDRNPNPVMSNLGLTDDAMLAQIADATNYPNYSHILEYYLRSSLIVQQRAEEGTEFITGSRLPYLATDIQEFDSSDASTDETKIVQSIGQLSKLAGDSKADAKLWMALGVQKQMLRHHTLAILRDLRSGSDGANDAAIATLQKDVQALQTEAKAAFDKAIRLAPEVAESYVRRAAFLLDRPTRSNDDRSDATPEEGKELELAVQDCTQALARDPAMAIAYHYRALAHIWQQNNELALANFNRAIEVNDRLAVAYMNRGTLHNGLWSFTAAVADFQAAYYCGFRRPILFANWGKALLGLEQYDLAIEKLSQAIAMNPDMAQPFADRGYAYYQLARFENAGIDYRRAIAKEPRSAVPHINLGLVEAAQGRHDAAIAEYDRALEIDDGTPKDAAFLYRGLSHQAIGKLTEAVDDLQRALNEARTEADKNNVRLPLALALAQAGRTEEARSELEKLMGAPDEAVTADLRAQAEALLARLGG